MGPAPRHIRTALLLVVLRLLTQPIHRRARWKRRFIVASQRWRQENDRAVLSPSLGCDRASSESCGWGGVTVRLTRGAQPYSNSHTTLLVSKPSPPVLLTPSPSRGCGLCIPYQTLTSYNPVYTINALPPPNHKTYTRHATVFACQQPLVFNPPEELARVQQVATPYGRGTLRSPIMLNGL